MQWRHPISEIRGRCPSGKKQPGKSRRRRASSRKTQRRMPHCDRWVGRRRRGSRSKKLAFVAGFSCRASRTSTEGGGIRQQTSVGAACGYELNAHTGARRQGHYRNARQTQWKGIAHHNAARLAVVNAGEQFVNGRTRSNQEIMFAQKGVRAFAECNVALATDFNLDFSEGPAPRQAFGDGFFEMREIIIRGSRMNRGRFVRLDGRDDVHRFVPETGVDRNYFRTAREHLMLPVCKCIEHSGVAVMQKIWMHAADAKARLRGRGNVKTKQRFGEQGSVAEITKKPPKRIERRRQVSATAP